MQPHRESTLRERRSATSAEHPDDYICNRINADQPESVPSMSKAETRGKTDQAKIAMSEEEWRSKLTPEQFYVTRQHGTERAFSHPYYEEKDAGMYRCVCCGEPVFSSETKFDSGTGWPSFLRTGEPRRGQRARRPFVLHAPHRGSLRQMRCASRPRLPGWTEADGCALLHQRCRLAVRQGCEARQG